MKIKVGSLFDGIGGAPLSAVLSGAEPVRIYHLISADTWDEQVKKAVFEKDMTQEALLKALSSLARETKAA